MTNKRLVLAGGGHAHLYLIKRSWKIKSEGIEPVLISSKDIQYYSGMASGYLEGIYTDDQASFDLVEMCNRYRVEFIRDTVTAIEPENRRVILRSGDKISFDMLSMDTGSNMAGEDVPGIKEHSVFVKPLDNLKTLKERIRKMSDDPLDVVIAGAGAAGIEIALALRSAGVIIVEGKNEILSGYDKKTREAVCKKLRQNDIEVITGEKIEMADKEYIYLTSGKKQGYDLLVWATGPSADPMYKNSGLKTDNRGFMQVNKYLQALDHPNIFGAGDCISFIDHDYVKKAGVYAIREAPYLYDNLMCFAKNRSLKPYIPQKDYLSIISTGNRTGVMSISEVVLAGKAPWRLKDRIDRRFINKYNSRTAF